MAADFIIKQDDRLPEFVVALKGTTEDGSLAAINLSGCTVRFIMTDKLTGTNKVDAAAQIVDAITGQVKYAWATGDTDTASTYKSEWEVTFADGRSVTFPNARYQTVKVVADLGGIV